MDFKRGQEPLKALGLSYGEKMKTNSWKILEFIKDKGEEGASFTEIQRFIYVDLKGYSEENFQKKDKNRWIRTKHGHGIVEPGLRSSRGYYTDLLYGGSFYSYSKNKGLLYKWCEKNDKGKWIIKKWPKPGENLLAESFKLVPESLNEIIDI